MHRETIAAALAQDRLGGELRYLGEIENMREPIRKLMAKLRKAHDALHCHYTTSPCGHGIHCHLTAMGRDCELVAPCRTLSRPGKGWHHQGRLEGLRPEIRDIAWKAQVRLCARDRR